ncbi:alpha/beta hydrolase [Algibacter amylolyticus]|uniref:Alpha/beta hydrolase n=1 Tax=Algibacter amylolyticus TaxID=1608400 RepID=A0A5M7BF77_9FLAO|nr:alpha/beta hydrolase [Algibacter amylolyticus]KAA5827979.1 alpha/beta hydrolase [Algibacter amylolyticus]MBB5267218.1 acetyl esterase/lipase [Algibacter amylolyticus]TSJ82224.1 alpha/beta hydrolase [Algibacter amylolyticus]
MFAIQNVKKDTSFTLNSAYNKYKKQFPLIKKVGFTCFSNVTEKHGVAYKTINDSKLYLDAFIHKNKTNPAVVLVHGGGWKSGDKINMHALAKHIASKGYSCFAINYRLADEAKYPQGVFDVKHAIRFIKSNAKQFHVDRFKVAILGASSGAQIATLVGATNNNNKFEEHSANKISSSVHAIINLDGVLAFHHPESKEGKMASYWLGGTYNDIPEIWEEASALSHISQNTPPILFVGSQYKRFHAGREDVIRVLNQYNIYNQVEIISDSPHTFWLFHPWFDKTVTHIITFLNNTFKN